VIWIPVAHIGGIPIEETLASMGPALLLVAGAASARIRALFHNRHEEVRHGDVRRNR
jgi:hypothetical protein